MTSDPRLNHTLAHAVGAAFGIPHGRGFGRTAADNLSAEQAFALQWLAARTP